MMHYSELPNTYFEDNILRNQTMMTLMPCFFLDSEQNLSTGVQLYLPSLLATLLSAGAKFYYGHGSLVA